MSAYRIPGPGVLSATSSYCFTLVAGQARPQNRLWWRNFGGGSATGSRVGALGGSSPIVSGAGPRTGLGARRRMMLGSITRSFRPPTIKMFDIVTADEDDASFSVDRERFDYCYPRWCITLRCLGRIGFVQTQTLPLNLHFARGPKRTSSPRGQVTPSKTSA